MKKNNLKNHVFFIHRLLLSGFMVLSLISQNIAFAKAAAPDQDLKSQNKDEKVNDVQQKVEQGGSRATKKANEMSDGIRNLEFLEKVVAASRITTPSEREAKLNELFSKATPAEMSELFDKTSQNASGLKKKIDDLTAKVSATSHFVIGHDVLYTLGRLATVGGALAYGLGYYKKYVADRKLNEEVLKIAGTELGELKPDEPFVELKKNQLVNDAKLKIGESKPALINNPMKWEKFGHNMTWIMFAGVIAIGADIAFESAYNSELIEHEVAGEDREALLAQLNLIGTYMDVIKTRADGLKFAMQEKSNNRR